jgi:hypothetical protein
LIHAKEAVVRSDYVTDASLSLAEGILKIHIENGTTMPLDMQYVWELVREVRACRKAALQNNPEPT